MNVLNWFKKKSQVDVTKELKPGSEIFKDPGEKEKLIINPDSEQFAAPTAVQQETADVDIYKSEGEKIPASTMKPYPKAKASLKVEADDVTSKSKSLDVGSEQFKDPGTKEKLQYPTKVSPLPEPKQLGLDIDKEAGTKKYKNVGEKEKLAIPTKSVDLPAPEIVVAEDKKIGEQFKDVGEKEKIITKPKQFTVPVSQSKSNISPTQYMHYYEYTKPIQKQFSYAGINWFKRTADDDSKKPWPAEKFESCVEKVMKANPELSKESANAICAKQMWAEASLGTDAVNVLLKFANECPECFDRLVLMAKQNLQKKKAALTPEEGKELASIADAATKGTLTPAQRTRLEELKTKAVQFSEFSREADDLSEQDFVELEEAIDITNFNEIYSPEINDFGVHAAAKRPPMKALKKLWEESGKSKEKCISKVKDEPFLKLKKDESKEDAAARFCRWLEMKIEGKAEPTRGPKAE